MKIKRKLLLDFIQKASLNGTIMTMKIEFNENEIISKTKDISNVTGTHTTMKSNVFTDYEAIGELYIKNSKTLIDYIKTFDDEIELIKKDTTLTLKDVERKVEVMLGSVEVCKDNVMEVFPTIPDTVAISLKEITFSKAIKDLSMTKNENSSIRFTNKNSELILEVGTEGQTDYFINKTRTDIEQEVSSKIGLYVTNVFEATNDLTIHLGNNMPITFEENTDEIKFKCLIAPLVD